jgi:hypothetical protein
MPMRVVQTVCACRGQLQLLAAMVYLLCTSCMPELRQQAGIRFFYVGSYPVLLLLTWQRQSRVEVRHTP